MSVTHSNAAPAPFPSHRLADKHPQLAPAVIAVAIAVVSVLVSLVFTGLPT